MLVTFSVSFWTNLSTPKHSLNTDSLIARGKAWVWLVTSCWINTWSYYNSSSFSTFSMKSCGCSGVRRRSASCRSWSPWISLIITFSRCCYRHRRPHHCHHSRLLHHRWSSWTSLIVSFSRCHHPNLSLPCFIVLVFIIISGYQGRANFSSVRILVVGGGGNFKNNHHFRRFNVKSWY